jgi:uncharacterized protein
MSDERIINKSRRGFTAALAGASLAQILRGQAATGTQTPNPNASVQNTSTPKKKEFPPETPPFQGAIQFVNKPLKGKVSPFPMTAVKLRPSIYLEVQNSNLGYLKRLDAERLLHNFRINAGLPSNARPLGGWEKPDCELRGHFVGHYLSACALMYSSTGDVELKRKGDLLVAELAKCQSKLGGSYLSAFPLSYFDRLNARTKVWAPFYTIHKIMAGMYDMHQECGNQQALEVLKGMADWADRWSAAQSEEHMQDILNTEYGGMNEVLYNLSSVTGDERYATAGDRFTKKKFFNPLALRRDELRGLHVNTHIPQVIGAARRYELSSDHRFHDVADFFWADVTGSRAYVTGGTSNGELWLTEPNHLGEELKKSDDTTECCCAYNMLKLTRQLYSWTGDPRYFDYYERVLLNHRLPAIRRDTGATQYYLSIVSGAWKTFNTENDSFWCCTGTGVEEFSKLNDSIYFHDADSLYVNLFIPSDLNWAEKKLKLSQETKFPDDDLVVLTVQEAPSDELALCLRIPYWTGKNASVRINGQEIEVTPSPESYFTMRRRWKQGDKIELKLPMSLHMESMPDEPNTQAFLYGPLVLAGKLGKQDLTDANTVGEEGPSVRKHPISIPSLNAASPLDSRLRPVSGSPLTFEASAQQQQIVFVPFDRVFDERYSIYWNVS